MDFTIEKYRELVLALKGASYEFVRYDEYCNGKRAERMIVMRHDVDRSVKRAVRLAKVEKEIGVRASYYFREQFIGEDVEFLPEVYKEGFIIGHTDNYLLVKSKGNIDDLNNIKEVSIKKVEYPYVTGE